MDNLLEPKFDHFPSGEEWKDYIEFSLKDLEEGEFKGYVRACAWAIYTHALVDASLKAIQSFFKDYSSKKGDSL